MEMDGFLRGKNTNVQLVESFATIASILDFLVLVANHVDQRLSAQNGLVNDGKKLNCEFVGENLIACIQQ